MKKAIASFLFSLLFTSTVFACGVAGTEEEGKSYRYEVELTGIVDDNGGNSTIKFQVQSLSMSMDTMGQISLSSYKSIDANTPALLSVYRSTQNIPGLKVTTFVTDGDNTWVSSTMEFSGVRIQYLSIDHSGGLPSEGLSMVAREAGKISVQVMDKDGKPSGKFINS